VREIIINLRRGLRLQYLLFLSDCNGTLISSKDFPKKISILQISWKSFQWHPSCTMQTWRIKQPIFAILRLTTPWRHTGRAEVKIHSFLTSAIDEGERSPPCYGRFNIPPTPPPPPPRNTPVPIIIGWAGPRVGMDVSEARKIPFHWWYSDPGSSRRYSSHYTDYTILALQIASLNKL
jgi:hypothetical protein